MTWEWVAFALGLALILCCTALGGINLIFLKLDRKKKDKEYKQLNEILQKMAKRERERETK